MLRTATLFTVLCFVCISFFAQAQYYTSQNKVWVFGDSVGVNFNSGVPVSFTSGFYGLEGSAMVSDAAGNLLFYTDGRDVWNRLGNIMPHGAAVVPYYTISASQSSLIIPVINDPERYYLFSMEHVVGQGRLSYSIVDISLDGTLGDIDTSYRGIPIRDSLTEHMIAVPGNNCNIWLVVHDQDSARFLAYEVTAAGINFSPIVSSVGIYSDYYGLGVAKVSPDRQRIACMYRSGYPSSWSIPSRTELFDFNASTGVVSNCKILNFLDGSYGAEFSPDNTKLYTYSVGGVFQYDLSLPTDSAVIASEYLVTSYPTTIGGSDLKLATDNKIYFHSPSSNYSLARINFPDLAGSACGFADSAVITWPHRCHLGLPNLFWMPIAPAITAASDEVCEGSSISLSATVAGGTWNSGSTGVAIVNAAGIVTGVASGTAIISYTTSCGIALDTVTVTSCLAVNHLAATFEPKLYPNPATNQITIDLPGVNSKIEIIFLDMLGRERKKLTTIPQVPSINLDISDITSGNYIVRVEAEGKTYRSRISVANER